MTAVTLPNVGIKAGFLPNESGWSDAMNKNLRMLDALVQAIVQDKDLATPPGSPVAGKMWIVGPSPTGAWVGQAGKLAIWQAGDDLTNAWMFITPQEGFLVYVLDEDVRYQHDGGAWAIFETGGGGIGPLPEFLSSVTGDMISYLSDLDTALTVGAVGAFTPAPRAAILTGVKINLKTASSSGVVTVKVKKNGVSILSTDVSIDAGELTSLTAATPEMISDDSVAADDRFTYEIVAAGTGAKGLMVTLLTDQVLAVNITNDDVTALSIASGVVTVDLSLGDYFTLDLSADVTSWVFTNPPGSGKGFSKIIEIKQNASAAKTVAWPAGTWDGAAPTISTTLSAVQLLSIISHNNGTTKRLTLSGVHA